MGDFARNYSALFLIPEMTNSPVRPGSVVDVHVRFEVARRREGLLADLALVRLLLKERGKEEFMKNIDSLEASMGIIRPYLKF